MKTTLQNYATGLVAPLVAFSVPLLFTGCSVLTKPEVQEVKTFATATKNYGTMPGGVIKACGDFSRYNAELSASTRSFETEKDAEEVRGHLEEARKAQQNFAAAAAKADKALTVLNTYADCLTALASDTYTDQLGQSATDLGKSLDSAVATYNKTVSANVGSFGAIVAGVVRGGGGLYIRHEQVKYLRQFISTADAKLIPAITRDIRALMTGTVPEKLGQIKKSLDGKFDDAATSGKRLPLGTIQTVNQWYEDVDNAEKLAEAAAKSANTYRAAHAKLAAAFNKTTSLADAAQEVQTLIDEVQAGKKIYDQLKK